MITDRQIQLAIKAATADKDTILNDGSGGRGTGALKLFIRKSESGTVAAIWYATWKIGKRGKKSIGRYPDVSLKDARDVFSKNFRPVIEAGKNPAAVVEDAEQTTVENLFKAYIQSLRDAEKPSADEVERILLMGKGYNMASYLGRDREAGSIEADDVSRALRKRVAKGARRQTDLARTFMCAAFNWGAQSTHDYMAKGSRDWGIKYNPVALVPRDVGANKSCDRNLSAKEVSLLWNDMRAGFRSIEVSSALSLIVATGQRVKEILRAHGSEIDLDAAQWNMPKHKTKMKKAAHIVPLIPQAVEIFRVLISLHGDGPLFPARKDSRTEKQGKVKSPYIVHTSLAHATRDWSLKRKLPRITPRDLRRTWKSRAGDGAGIDRFTRDLIQQHAKNDTGSKHYDLADYLPQMREAMTRWGQWLAAVTATEPVDIQLAA